MTKELDSLTSLKDKPRPAAVLPRAKLSRSDLVLSEVSSSLAVLPIQEDPCQYVERKVGWSPTNKKINQPQLEEEEGAETHKADVALYLMDGLVKDRRSLFSKSESRSTDRRSSFSKSESRSTSV